jgi:heme exporter protein B
MRALFLAVLLRDLRLAARRRVDALLPLVFFVAAVSLFPLGVGPEPNTLRQIAPGVVWVCALLATMLSVNQLYAADQADGSLEQMLLAPQPATVVAAAKSLAHWLVNGAPLIAAAPLVGLLFDLSAAGLGALVLTLLLGTPVLSLLGGLGAALTLLPLAMPALIFGAGAVVAVETGLSAAGHYSLLGALLIATALGAPPATAAALRISTE